MATYTETNPDVGPLDNPEVQINIGKIEFDDNGGKFIDDVQGSGLFTDCFIRNRYEKNPHTFMLPITSPNGFQNQKAAFVRLAEPTLVWISEWTIAKLGEKPIVPNPAPASSNWVLISANPAIGESYDLPTILVGPDGVTPLYRISGTYIYGCKNPDQDTIVDTNWPRMPWVVDDFDRSLSSSLFASNIIDTTLVLEKSISPGVP